MFHFANSICEIPAYSVVTLQSFIVYLIYVSLYFSSNIVTMLFMFLHPERGHQNGESTERGRH